MGREFMHIFDEWAESYDQTVSGHNEQYREVFRDYQAILERVVELSYGVTLEFGVGTGNLTEKLVTKGVPVIAVEPNLNMRLMAQERFPNLTVHDGDFLNFPKVKNVETIVSSYAFHHLTDDEKFQAMRRYYDLLTVNGQIVFADTMFKDDTAFREKIEEAKNKGFPDLAEDLTREYYTTIPKMKQIGEQAGYQVEFEQLNDFVWLTHAKKQ
ncbi:class I SAM-dependent methyltransferase [Alkalibacillus aidingensis]|uniref:class I SAM-dependent methyltransferase n=1 Tax=Alkalibacillus aidingensis TaxID=2747607 RepID=UPI0016606167|nr:class I SAM-dependent methyltransferase [Alkalibacillus aidingensis]